MDVEHYNELKRENNELRLIIKTQDEIFRLQNETIEMYRKANKANGRLVLFLSGWIIVSSVIEFIVKLF